MKRKEIYRPSAKLEGKVLSAHTVASFCFLQGISEPQLLQAGFKMRADALFFLIRKAAIIYWTKKENMWLKKDGDVYLLEYSGRKKAIDRATGNAGAQSFNNVLFQEALSRIKGELQDCGLENYAYYEKDEDLDPIPKGTDNQKTSITNTVLRKRIKDIKKWVLRSANGVCEMCKSPAPFTTDAGIPYLEVHHVIPLSEDGPDTIQNAVALCPNCHRKLHYSDKKSEEIDMLCKLVARLVKE